MVTFALDAGIAAALMISNWYIRSTKGLPVSAGADIAFGLFGLNLAVLISTDALAQYLIPAYAQYAREIHGLTLALSFMFFCIALRVEDQGRTNFSFANRTYRSRPKVMIAVSWGLIWALIAFQIAIYLGITLTQVLGVIQGQNP